MTRGGLGAATLGLFGGMFALEVAYAAYVAKIRHVDNNIQTQNVETKTTLNDNITTQKQIIPPIPPPPLIESDNKPIEVKAGKKPVDDTSGKTVYSTDIDGTSNLHISIIINTPKYPTDGTTKNVNYANKSDNECCKNLKQEKKDSCSLTTSIEDKKRDFINSEKLREVLIGSASTQDHRANIKDATKGAFSGEDDIFLSEEPFRLGNKLKMENKYQYSSPNNVENSRQLNTNKTVTLKCNKNEKIEVIPITSSPHEVNKKWHSNTELLPPK